MWLQWNHRKRSHAYTNSSIILLLWNKIHLRCLAQQRQVLNVAVVRRWWWSIISSGSMSAATNAIATVVRSNLNVRLGSDRLCRRCDRCGLASRSIRNILFLICGQCWFNGSLVLCICDNTVGRYLLSARLNVYVTRLLSQIRWWRDILLGHNWGDERLPGRGRIGMISLVDWVMGWRVGGCGTKAKEKQKMWANWIGSSWSMLHLRCFNCSYCCGVTYWICCWASYSSEPSLFCGA